MCIKLLVNQLQSAALFSVTVVDEDLWHQSLVVTDFWDIPDDCHKRKAGRDRVVNLVRMDTSCCIISL